VKLGASAYNWTRTFEPQHFDLLPRLREHGLQAFEVPIFDPASVLASPIRKALEANHLACTVCAILPGEINPISAQRSDRSRAHDHLVRCVETAAELGANLLGGPLYAPIGYLPGRRRTEDEWQWAIECFQELGDLLHACSMTLALEPVNRSETFFLTTVGEAAELCRAIGHERIGVLVDTFHANIEEKDLSAVMSLLGARLKHIHVSENDRGIPGTGHVDFAEMMHTLQQMRYEGFLVIEGLGYAPPAQNCGPGFMWRRPEETGDAIVFQGADYLRGLFSQG
jgi:D-psicose/D-tagatose/L-ribulose 3-epimerase